MSHHLSRRDFLCAATVSAATISLQGRAAAAAMPAVCVFSKHLKFLDYAGIAKTGKDLGLDGIDLTVRDGGHVLPANVAKDLPKAVEAIRSEGLDVPMITTSIKSGDDTHARPILEAASAIGIKYFRIGGHEYTPAEAPLDTLKKTASDLQSLAKLCDQTGMTAGYHNHSGEGQVAGPLWDLLRVVETVGSTRIGANLDTGHAMAEGAAGAWVASVRALSPHVKMMSVKDFVWSENKIKWVPFGEGAVNTVDFLKIVKAAGFAGPISIHFEYKTEGDDALLLGMREAALKLRGYLREAGYA
jgi:L-ribulose-5-phosphate 3-epimerase